MADKNSGLMVAIVIILAVLVANNLGLFSIFSSTNNLKLTQYNIAPEDRCVYLQQAAGLPGDVNICGSSWQGLTFDPFFESIFTDTVVVKSGQNTFEFKTLKSTLVTDFGAIPPAGVRNPDGYGCWQKTEVRKNGVLIDTVRSWGDNNDPYNTENYWNNKEFIFYDDASSKSGVKFRTIQNTGTITSNYYIPNIAMAGGCKWFINQYEIFFDNSTFDVNISSKIENGNLSIKALVKNNINIPVNGTLKLNLKSDTILGSVEQIKSMPVFISPGQNEFVFFVPLVDDEFSLSVSPVLDISYPGNSFDGLNYYLSTSQIAQCFNTGSGGCQDARTITSNKPKEVLDSDYIPIGSVYGDTTKISIKNSIIINSTSNSTVIQNQNLSCVQSGCPEGYRCDGNVCIEIEPFFEKYSSIFFVIIIAIILIVVYITRRK